MDFLRAAGMAIPILFVALIGFRLECIHVDVLHTVEQGFGSHIVGTFFGILQLSSALSAERRKDNTLNASRVI
jgi:hypothetical protein